MCPRSLCSTCLVILVALSASAAAAPPKNAASSRLCVDAVKLKSGKTIRGAIVHESTDGTLTMAVSRAWLKDSYPDLFTQRVAAEATEQKQAWEQLRDRLKQELAGPDESKIAVRCRLELDRIEALLAKPEAAEPPQFIWFDIDSKRISKVTSASTERRSVALWAWSEQLANVEKRDDVDLTRELKQLGIDSSQPPPDLSDRLPARQQDEREWSARLALANYAAGEPLDFQGTGNMLVAAGANRDDEVMSAIVGNLFGQQLDSLLKDLLDEGSPANKKAEPSNDWLKPAVREAEQKKASAFRATRVNLNPNGRRVEVESAFAVQLSDGKWETIWTDRNTADASQERPDVETRIANDPQIKGALDAVSSLGVGSEQKLQEAIRFGAATMAAQQAVDGRFALFRDSLLKRLDGPPIWKVRIEK